MNTLFEYLNQHGLPEVKCVVQVGASGGQELEMFAINGVKSALLVEPLEYPYQVLLSKCNQFPGYIPVQCAAGSQDHQDVTMYVANNGGQSSSILKPARHEVIFPHVTFEESRVVKSFTLDTLVYSVRSRQDGFPSPVDLLYVDVQGAELEVFKGACKTLSESTYVFTEVGLGGGYDSDASYVDIIQFLEFHKFKMLFLDINPRTGYGDAFFAKDKVLFR